MTWLKDKLAKLNEFILANPKKAFVVALAVGFAAGKVL
jgi:hypothetical protein